MAFSVGLSPSEFWDLTPLEFEACVQGYAKRRAREHNDLAFIAANIIYTLGMWKKRPSFQKILKSMSVDNDG